MKGIPLFGVIFALTVAGILTFFFIQNRNGSSPLTSNNNQSSWTFDYNTKIWHANGSPPECVEPLVFSTPVDVSLASGILYPGQIRGGDYKPHGGFRFDNRSTNDIEVRAIMDGYLLKASKYLEAGEEQLILFYVNECGLMVMHDHFLTLSLKLESALAFLPLNKEGDSRTTNIEPKVFIKKGEVLATEIGHKDFHGQKNIFVDFGLYDLRKTNGIVYDSAFRANNPNITEYGVHALCWFDFISTEDERIVRSLPAGGYEGKASDYCK
jgi:hypothetical protein